MAPSSIINLSNQLLRNLLASGTTRCLSTSTQKWGADSRDKRLGHLELSDRVEGEYGTIASSSSAFELVDERLMDKVINGVRFRDIPMLHLICTRNNTKMLIVRPDGEVLSQKSAGTEGYKNCRKGTTVAAQAVANRILTVATDNEIDTVRMVFKGLGPGRNAAYKVIELSNLNVVSLSDRSPGFEPWHQRPRKAKRI